MHDVMIDIETLGTRPGSVIASIGAVEFDATSGAFGRELHVMVELQSAQRAGLTIDASTVKWWMQQGEDARAKTFATGQHVNICLIELQFFVENVEPVRIWAHSPSFDLVLLEEAFRATNIKCPWSYKQPRDTRTLYDLAGVKIQSVGTHHDALDDAKAQATAVIEAYRALGMSNQPPQSKTLRWQPIETAPKTGEEFIGRTGPEWSGFSCFWDGAAFVHLDIDDGAIRYSPTEWMPMPAGTDVIISSEVDNAN